MAAKNPTSDTVTKSLELNDGTARVHFMARTNGKMGFFAESKKTKQSVSIEFRANEISQIQKFFEQPKAQVLASEWDKFKFGVVIALLLIFFNFFGVFYALLMAIFLVYIFAQVRILSCEGAK